MANGQASPPQLDDTPFPQDVKPSAKERVLRGVGGFVAGGAGLDFKGSPLDEALNKAHQRRLYESQLHWKNYTTYTSIAHLKVGSPDPTTGNPLTAEDIARYKAWADAAYAGYEKAAGVDKETKQRIQMGKQRVDALSHAMTQGEGGGQQPPASGSAPPQYEKEGMAGGPAAASAVESQRQTQQEIQSGVQKDAAAVEQRKKTAGELQLKPGSLAYQEFVATGKFPAQHAYQGVTYEDPAEPGVFKSGNYDKDSGHILDENLQPVVGARRLTSVEMTPKRFTYIGPNGEPLIGLQIGKKFEDQEGNPLPPNTEVYMRGAVPTETLRQVITVGPDGNPQVNTLETIRTPFKLGKKPTGGTAAPQTGKPKGASARSGATPPPQVQTPAEGEKDARGKPLGLPTGMYNAQLKRSTAIREASVQAFGDPTNPNFKPLKEFAKLADDQGSQKRLGTALKLTFDGLENDEKAHGSFVGLIQAYAGVPQALAAAKANVQKDVIDALNPEEQDAFDATISAFSSFTAARSLTSASAAQFSVKALERDIPIIGVTATSSRMFYDKLGRMGEIIYSGSKGTSGVAMPSAEKDYLLKQLEEVNKLKEGKSGPRSSMTPPPKAGTSTSIDDDIRAAVKAAKGAGNSASAKPSAQPQL